MQVTLVSTKANQFYIIDQNGDLSWRYSKPVLAPDMLFCKYNEFTWTLFLSRLVV